MRVLKCLRCDTIQSISVTDAKGDEMDLEIDDMDVDIPEGFLTYLCHSCATPKEAKTFILSSAATNLANVEENLANINMVLERIPTAGDDPKFKKHLAEIEHWRDYYTTVLEALLELPEEDKEDKDE